MGILFTAIIQSSTAAIGVFIAFLATGVIKDIDQSFFLIMGTILKGWVITRSFWPKKPSICTRTI
ncbi:MAG: hypothetical protein GX781_07905 [Clostridiales bacterium]|nr:hypothetical protein [Clostridiales bacterium]